MRGHNGDFFFFFCHDGGQVAGRFGTCRIALCDVGCSLGLKGLLTSHH